MAYKLKTFKNPETHAHGNIIAIINTSTGEEEDRYFGSEEDAFDYIKMFLEKDEDYKNNVVHPSDNIMNLYNQMDVIDQIIIKQSMIRRYRAKCMREYFKEM